MTSQALTQRRPTEHEFLSFDGARLFYRHWPGTGTSRTAIVMFHRGHEHGGRMAHLVDELELPQSDFFAWDARGLGRSSGERGYADHVGVLIKDVDAFVRHIATCHGIAMSDIAVVAQSVGAVLVAAWVHDYAPPIRAMILASPAFKVRLYVPFARPGLRLWQTIRKKSFVNSYVKARYLTHSAERIASYNTDPLITRPIAVNILLGLYETAERVIADAAAITVPTLLLISGSDWVVHQRPQHAFFKRLGSREKEVYVLDGFYHDTLGERDRAVPLRHTHVFLSRLFDAPPSPHDWRNADTTGPSKEEFDRLSAPPTSPLARGYWSMSRFWIAVGAKLSDGLALSVQTGFDSGSTLDYVYRNAAAGRSVLGRYIDRVYLNSIGWRGIRVRKTHLERLIHTAIDELTAADLQVFVVDIAAGHGRYILDALSARRDSVGQILLRDYSPVNVDAGRRLIIENGMERCASFVEGNAFDRASLAALTPKPTLAVVSGLYELFPDNEPIRDSLRGLAEGMADGAYLVYTCQPWHPQLELIARSLTSHRQGRAWVMRRRCQGEMDQLVADAGFEKLSQYTDQWGIFTVSLSRKRAAAAP